MRRISIQRAGHLNLPVTDIPQTITRHVERDIATLSRVQVHVYRIDKHCQTWDAAAAADMREQIHGTRGPVIVSMCRHLHQPAMQRRPIIDGKSTDIGLVGDVDRKSTRLNSSHLV